jgi:stage II sporulation protein AA (anti-sigma F factor antagonist)
VIKWKRTVLEREKRKTERNLIEMCAARDRKPGFDSEFTGTVLKIKLRGEIDHHSAVAVRAAIDDMIRSKRPCELVIDMSAVDFMDSSGLGLIMGRYNTMKEIGGTLTVADPNPATEKIMNLAGMERIVRITHSSRREFVQNKKICPSTASASVANSVKKTNETKKRNNIGGDGNEKRKI